ncbi:MAG: 4-diphosphocytidyl-2-C-methyl-D-erythritol kinase [Eubacteriales bacterium]|nr:4-diphosphocytidyl-2-C-methyl-D-erythritol kinase [Eubacteriales bacterium]
METISLQAPAKINLSLDVWGRREDGYHEVEMIMQTVALHDVLHLRRRGDGEIVLQCRGEEVPAGPENLVWKAAVLLKEQASLDLPGVEIVLEKNIPVAAGLAGGSTDGAAALRGLNRLWGLNYSREQLLQLGGRLGADVPFCLLGGTALARGRGEKLQPLPPAPFFHVVLAKPRVAVPTAEVYRHFRPEDREPRPDTAGLVEAIRRGDREGIRERLVNVLERVTRRLFPEVAEAGEVATAVADRLFGPGKRPVVMSGSGPTFFCLLDDEEESERLAQELTDRLPVVIKTFFWREPGERQNNQELTGEG